MQASRTAWRPRDATGATHRPRRTHRTSMSLLAQPASPACDALDLAVLILSTPTPQGAVARADLRVVPLERLAQLGPAPGDGLGAARRGAGAPHDRPNVEEERLRLLVDVEVRGDAALERYGQEAREGEQGVLLGDSRAWGRLLLETAGSGILVLSLVMPFVPDHYLTTGTRRHFFMD